MPTQRETLSEVTSATLTKAWATWGAVDDDVLTHLVNPAFHGRAEVASAASGVPDRTEAGWRAGGERWAE